MLYGSASCTYFDRKRDVEATTELKFMRGSPRQDQHGVRNDSLNLHRTSHWAFVQRIQIKTRSQIFSSCTAHHANLRGHLLPATDAGVAFMDTSAHLLGPMKATQQTWRARFSSAIFLSEFQYSFCAGYAPLCDSQLVYFFLRNRASYFSNDILELIASKFSAVKTPNSLFISNSSSIRA